MHVHTLCVCIQSSKYGEISFKYFTYIAIYNHKFLFGRICIDRQGALHMNVH